VTYKKGQCVTYRGSVWVAKARVCGKKPPSEEWQQSSSADRDGKDFRPEAVSQ